MNRINKWGVEWTVFDRKSELVKAIGEESFVKDIDEWWLVAEFTEGRLWMNNLSGHMVLITPGLDYFLASF